MNRKRNGYTAFALSDINGYMSYRNTKVLVTLLTDPRRFLQSIQNSFYWQKWFYGD